MNRLIFSVILLIYFTHIYGQTTEMTFIGTATVAGGATYTYKLAISDSNGTVSGYSVTDVLGPNETKAALKGKMDVEQRHIRFHETKLLYTKSTEADTNFCYLKARLKMSEKGGATYLRGSFTGYKKDGKTVCATGKMNLFNAQDLLAKLEKMAGKRDTVKDPTLTQDQIVVKKNAVMGGEKPAPFAPKVITVLPGKTLELHCASPQVTIEIWDDKNVDGDVITLLHNGTPILTNYSISKTHKTLQIDMAGQKNQNLQVIAVSEGTEPPNTARIMVSSGGSAQYIDACTTTSQPVYINLIRE
jgi:hypothetical protein